MKNKKNLILWGTAVVLVAVAIIVTQLHKNGSGKSSLESPPSTAAPSVSTQTNPASTEAPSASAQPGAPSGEQANNFTLSDLNGKKVSLSDFRGKSVYLNFWASWCPPCRGEMPDIEKVYQQYKDKDFVVLAVNLGEDKNTVQKFISQNNYSFRVLLDSNQKVADDYSINAIPVSYFIDKNGNVMEKRIGALSPEEIQSYVKALVGG